MFEFTKLPPKSKSSILAHVSGILLCLSVFFYLVFTFVSRHSHRCANDVVPIDPYEHHFNTYLKSFGKQYEDKEYHLRLKNFKRSLKEIERLNSDHDETIFGWTKFSDMTPEEFQRNMLLPSGSLGQCNDIKLSCHHNHTVAELADQDIPDEFDWRDHNVVGPVLDQGMCRSCWAFSVVGVMESMLLINKQIDSYQRLSIQELTDCSKGYTDQCNNGSVTSALKFLCYERAAITTEEQYPLTNKNEICYLRPDSGITITNMVVKCDMEAKDIARVVALHGPVVAVVDSYPWKNYIDGIIQYHCSDKWDHIKHVVQIVGYNMMAEVPYFILRNSWGADFGDNGYVRVSMDGFMCGIGRQISYFNVTKIKY